jgi:hypothetical protein
MWIAAVVFLVLAVFMLRRGPMTRQTSSSGRVFLVKRGPGQELVADRLDALTRRMEKFLDAADAVSPGDDRVRKVRERWNGTLSETTSGSQSIAYSMNKNDVHVCVRCDDAPDGQLEDMNTSTYVLLHELAHVATDEYGHTPEFWRTMRWFLEVAEDAGMYEFQDFATTPVRFCGKALGNNVLSCVKEKRCEPLLKPKK